jgi:hypothetical protein
MSLSLAVHLRKVCYLKHQTVKHLKALGGTYAKVNTDP